MIKAFLIILIFITGCTLTFNDNVAKSYPVDVPYYLHFKNKSSTEKPTIKIADSGGSIIFETISAQTEERHQRGKILISGKYYVIVSFPHRNPTSEVRNNFIVEGNEKQIEIGLNIQSAP